jgi:glycosyltransferase involved in cell wall biosynthesis
MKVVIQIPCRDEAATLPATIAALPRAIPGVDAIDIVVVDDGSTDDTAAIATSLGAHVATLHAPRGLAVAFMTGIEAALSRDADVIVNTDGDNQYVGEDVTKLVVAVMRGDGDVAIGARPIAAMPGFSPAKKLLQRIGSWVVRRLSGVDVVDATSGFRAYSRESALQLSVFSGYTYTLETIVQCAQRGLRIASIPVRVNPVDRPSRLAKGSAHYVWRAGTELARMFVVYRPFRFFILPAIVSTIAGTALVTRFAWYFIESGGVGGHVQSLIVAAILLGIGGALVVVALIGDLLAINRRMLEEIRLDARRRRFEHMAASPASSRSG